MKNSQLICLLSFVLLMGFLFPILAMAGDGEGNETRFSVTPRFWLSFFNFPDEDDATREVSILPLYGGTIGVSPGFLPNFDILVTAFHGTADNADIIFQDSLIGLGQVTLEGESDQERTDIEGLLRYHFPQAGVFIAGGARYVKVNIDDKFSTVFGTYKRKTEIKLILGEIATGLHRDLSEDGLHRGFGNLTVLAGHSDSTFKENRSIAPGNPNFNSSDKSFIYGADINAGYQFWFLPNGNVSLRYRMFVLLGENDFGLLKTTTVHGPEASIGFVF